MACYISSTRVLNIINEEPLFGPAKCFVIKIFGRSVSSIYTKSEDFLHYWITPYIPDPRQIPRNNIVDCRLIVGLDIKMLDAVGPNPPLACIQVCLHGRTIIYHMYNDSGLPVALERLLTDPNNTFVGVHLENALDVLRYWGNFEGHVAYRDLGQLAADQYMRDALATAEFTELVAAVMGRDLTLKVDGHQFLMEDVDPQWDMHELLDEQVLCASVAAYLSYEMGRILLLA